MIHLVYYVVKFLNAMSATTVISEKLLPREIVLWCRLEWQKHCTRGFGEYVEAYKDPDITNTLCSCTYIFTYLEVTDKIQGTIKFFNLKTGTVKKPNSATTFSTPECAIDLVNT